MAACYYALDTKDKSWLTTHYAGIKSWADKMIATDKNNDGIIEYGYSGNANSWSDKFKRPANWWDTIGFGHDDAYSNILAYRACTLLAQVAASINKKTDSDHYKAFAARCKKNFYSTFYNPATGILGGWRSEDGVLHDYYFLFVNSMAITYDLVDAATGKKLMHTLLAKMKEAGYTNFSLGLPGNLVPIADAPKISGI
jgi:glycogen debranching enzyme